MVNKNISWYNYYVIKKHIRHNTSYREFIINLVINMKVKIFDEAHEKDLESSINAFLTETEKEIIDIKFQVAVSIEREEQIYCFSAMILYK